MDKRLLTKVVGENFKIAKDKAYTSNNGKEVILGSTVEEMIKNTEIIEEINVAQVLDEKVQCDYVVRDNIVNMGTISCILKLRKEGIEGNIIALDFASAVNAGGGYLSGSKAQEESLCRASMLFESLVTQKEFYGYNRANYTPLYNDRMIYVPNVPVIRNDNLELLDKLELASFIVSPAVNKRRAYAEGITDDNLINSVMDKRIEKILKLAVSKNPSAVILGAYGCGVFGNNREIVYDLFEKHIKRIVPQGVKVVFAVL